MAVATGYILQSTGQNYSIVFMIAGTTYLLALAIIHLLVPQLEPVENVEHGPAQGFHVGALIGFGFVGLIFGSFVGWCTSLALRVSGQVQFEYMMIAGGIGVVIGVFASLLFNNRESR
jgi:hypothetical protein